MSLERYAKKRQFDQTPEPLPGIPGPPQAVFCVQRHRARRLHYDLRIEVAGTLKSWAVPQGPTLDPAIRRLAVHVEDHPLLYADFEGNIPQGNYGAGSMMLWDRGPYEMLGDLSAEQQLERGDFKFRLHGEKLRGEFALVRMKSAEKGNEWLLLKKKDAEARPGWDIEQHAWSVKTGRTQDEIANDAPARVQALGKEAPIPESIEPMLAQLAAEPPEGSDWSYEVKWDGVRALCFFDHGRLRLVSRKGTEITSQYPEVAAAAAGQIDAETAILDGEIAAPDENGRPSFERLQPRIMARGKSAIEKLSRSRPVRFFVFDLLYWNGRDVRGEPLRERKRLLRRVLRPNETVSLSDEFEVSAHELLAAVREQGLEGIVAKHGLSAYRSGRSRDWIKVKATRQQDFVICGFTEGERDHFGALLLGIYDAGKLVFAGSVGTGFDQKLMQAIRKRLDALETKRSPFKEKVTLPQPIHWTRPEQVCTVKYLEWTSEGRLRAPVFVGLRDDIEPQECVRESAASGPPSRAKLLPPDKPADSVRLDGRQFTIQNLDKVFYPDEGYTKRDLIEYYHAVADLLLPHLDGRPLSLRRYPDGIAKEGFFQKNAEGLPEWLHRETVIAEDGNERVMAIGGRRVDLIYLANLGCIDQNPWMSRVSETDPDSLDHPDFLLVDLDPHECEFDKIVEAALLVRRLLDQMGLEGYPKTTGGDGMHVYVPLEPVYLYEQTRAFAEILARLATKQRPDLFTTPRHVGKRVKGKVYFDWVQNARGKTISAPYVPRAYPGAPVATPLAWSEVREGLDPKQFHIRNALTRFDTVGDLFADVLTKRQRLESALERVEKLAVT